MSRLPRVFEADGIYHVISRGSNREPIYRFDGDRAAFLDRVGRVVERYDLRWIGYCLMGNHYHLIVQTPDGRLSNAMRDLNGGYSRLCRSLYARDAHLFKNRFRAKQIDTPEYLLWVMSYSDLNPVRAGLCGHPKDWPWSSYRAVAGLDPPLRRLVPDVFLRNLGKDIDVARTEYIAYVDALAARERCLTP